MSLTNLFAKIAGRHQERQLARKADFKALVKAVAEEQLPDPEEVERILEESNKTLEDLQRAVELYLKRRALKSTVDQKPKLEKDREQINKQLSQAGEALTAAEKKYKETTDPLLGQRDYIRDQMLEIERAKTELERTCDDQDLLNELAKTERQLNVLHTRRNEAEFALSERKRRSTELKEAVNRLENPREVANRDEAAVRKQIEDLRDRVAHHEKEITELLKTLATINEQIPVAEQLATKLHHQRLVP
jgi:chromosome segregation ATPase